MRAVAAPGASVGWLSPPAAAAPRPGLRTTRLVTSTSENVRLSKALEVETERTRLARAANRGVVQALRRAESAQKASVADKVAAEEQVTHMQGEVQNARKDRDEALAQLKMIKVKTEGMVPAREAEQQRALIKDLQRDLENLKTKHGSLQQEHSTIIATLRQLTARREQMEVRFLGWVAPELGCPGPHRTHRLGANDGTQAEQDRINRIRQVTLSRPPPKWMRRLATKLQVAVKWRAGECCRRLQAVLLPLTGMPCIVDPERGGGGEERVQLDEGTHGLRHARA